MSSTADLRVATPPVDADAGPAPERAAAAPLARLRGASWRHWFREVAVIAAGALAALAAQAWWSDRQDAEREDGYLRQLAVDVRENASRLDRAIEIDSTVKRSASRLSDALSTEEPLPPADSLTSWIAAPNKGVMSASDFQPVNGTLTALLTTGDLRIIRDENLRTQLVAYAARMEGERENLRYFLQQGFSQGGHLPRLLPFVSLVFSNDERRFTAAARRFRFEGLRGNPDFAEFLFTIQAANANRLEHLRGMRRQSVGLLRVLEAQRAGGQRPPARDTSARRAR